jgi:pyochelin synthetase
MEEIKAYISALEKKGVRLNEEEGKIKYKAAKGLITPEDFDFLKANKADIIEFLQARSSYFSVKVNPEAKFEPFPLTSIQEAYLLGRNPSYRYGGLSCHIYLEIEYPSLDPDKVEGVWRQLIKRHGMLRTIFYQNGYQQELSEVPEFKVLRARGEEESLGIRKELSHKMYPIDQWPLFDIGVSRIDDKSLLHFSTEFLIVDWTSIWMLLAEFEGLYFRQEEKTPLTLNFRDYVLAEKQLKNDPRYERDKAYWLEKIPNLYEGPKLPLSHTSQLENTFERMQLELSPDHWQGLKNKCKEAGITPTSLILTLYAKVLGRYSETSNFSINMIMLNRLPIHEQVNDIIGDFTSNTLIPIELKEKESFSNQIKEVNQTLFESLDHKLFSGIEILRELSRSKGMDAAFMPYVFTSAIGIAGSESDPMIGKILNTGISQTPQVFIDCQVMDGDFGLRVNWDVRQGIFYEGYLEDMFHTFEKAVLSVASPEIKWHQAYTIDLPDWQLKERHKTNDTQGQMHVRTLHESFLNQADKTPHLMAVADNKREFTYRQVMERAMAVAEKIKEMGGVEGDRIGIMMPKNAYQVVGVLGILLAGGIYVPIEDDEAFDRIDKIVTNTHMKLILTHCQTNYQSDRVKCLVVDQVKPLKDKRIEYPKKADQPAYIIHTSGSTGVPKGVVINHQAALNTIDDINERFDIKEGDRVLGLSKLNFDLSVYDIFGLLSVGGALIYPDAKSYSDPSHWVSLIKKHDISVWNTVPSIMVMLDEYMKSKTEEDLTTLKAVLLSGDWIPLNLPDNASKFLPNAKIVSLGGATEASIWSICHEYKGLSSGWVSIPYGKPLKNQQIHILNKDLEENPVWLKGDLYIGGEGLAVEYFGNKEITDAQFFYAPSLGKRLYKTGDTGRYMPGGDIEFLGREDKQVKVLGYRIELGEIESAIKQHPKVEGAVVVTLPVGNSVKIMAAAWGALSDDDDEVKNFIKKKLPAYMIPYKIFKIEKVPLTANSKVDRKAIKNHMRTQMDALSQEVAPDTEVNLSGQGQQIKDIVCNIMELETIDTKEELYALGADSLVMNRIAVSLEEAFSQYCNFEEILIQLLSYPTIEAFDHFINQKKN